MLITDVSRDYPVTSSKYMLFTKVANTLLGIRQRVANASDSFLQICQRAANTF
jgi:hypothetical protein